MPTQDPPARFAHAALFVVGMAVALLDILARQFAGPIVGGTLVLPLAAIAIGLSRESSQRAGWRPMLAAGDIATVLGAGALVVRPGIDRFIAVPMPVIAVVVALGLVSLASLAIARGAGPARSRIDRSLPSAVLLIVLVVLWLVYVFIAIWQRPPEGGRSFVELATFVAAPVAAAAVILWAWWLASPWLLFAFGAQTLASAVALGPTGLATATLWPYAAFSAVAVVAAFVGPREVFLEAGSTPRTGSSAAAAVWLGLGAILYVPTVLWGLFPLGVIVDCFDACPGPIPGAGVLVALSALSVLVVAATALGYVGGGRGRAASMLLALSLAGSLLVGLEVGLGLAGAAPFTFLPVAAPAVTLVMLGSGAGLFRPGWLGGASYRAALASALVAIVWIYSAIARVGIGPAQSMAMAAGAVLALAIAHESSRSGRLAPAVKPVDESPPAAAGSVDAISG